MGNAANSSKQGKPTCLATFRLALRSGLRLCRYAQLLKQFGGSIAALVGLSGLRRRDLRIASLKDAETAIANAVTAGADILLHGDDAIPFRLAEKARTSR